MTEPAKPSYTIVSGRQDTNAKDAVKGTVKHASANDLGVVSTLSKHQTQDSPLMIPVAESVREAHLQGRTDRDTQR
jgi:hypothetical protein